MIRRLKDLTDDEIKEIYQLHEKLSDLAEQYGLATHSVRAINARYGKRIQTLTEGLVKNSVKPELESAYPNALKSPARRIRKFLSILKRENNGCWTVTSKSVNNLGIPMFFGLDRYKKKTQNKHGPALETAIGGMVTAKRYAWNLYRGPLPDGACLIHTDECKANCYKSCVNPYHLIVGNQQDVVDNAVEQNYGKQNGNRNPDVFLSKEQVTDIYMSTLSTKEYVEAHPELEMKYHVVYNVRRNYTYRFITEHLEQPEYNKAFSITDEDVRRIQAAPASTSAATLAEIYGISASTAFKIRNRQGHYASF